MMTSAKKDILLQSQQIQKQEYPIFEFVFQYAMLPNMIFMVPKCALGKFLLAATFLDINFVKIIRKRGEGYAQV